MKIARCLELLCVKCPRQDRVESHGNLHTYLDEKFLDEARHANDENVCNVSHSGLYKIS